MDDCNIVALVGRLAAPIDLHRHPSGSVAARYLVTVRAEAPVRRVDVLPVVWWDPPDHAALDVPVGTPVMVVGSVRRRFWAAEDGRRSRLELVAGTVEVGEGVLARPVEVVTGDR